jgi:hypothetical protein
MDNAVPLMPDYLSLGLFYGCKELFGDKMDCLEEIPYAYDDYDKDVAELYGRGFNYTNFFRLRQSPRLRVLKSARVYGQTNMTSCSSRPSCEERHFIIFKRFSKLDSLVKKLPYASAKTNLSHTGSSFQWSHRW